MKKIKVGVIGTGHLGKFHVKLLSELENVQFVGVHDIDEKKGKEISEEFNTVFFPNLDDLLNNVNAVSVVTTTSSHYEIVKKVFEKNIHVFVEKPITSKISDAEELVKLASSKNLVFQVGHIERFNPALLALDKFNLNPTFIQTDRLAQFNPRGTDVAVVLDLMIHDIDIILSLVKSDVKSISASGVAVVSDSIDIANARLEFENGAVANVTASRISQKKMRKMRMFQKDSYISVDFQSGVSEVFRLITPEEVNSGHFMTFGEMGVGDKKRFVVYEQPEIVEVNALKHELGLFVNAVQDGTQPVVSGNDGLKALIVAEEIITKIEYSKTN
ncbi:MAG: Gfo/Idh/MocA family oxidoreductase [Melioribacteraceae bacterium]